MSGRGVCGAVVQQLATGAGVVQRSLQTVGASRREGGSCQCDRPVFAGSFVDAVEPVVWPRTVPSVRVSGNDDAVRAGQRVVAVRVAVPSVLHTGEERVMIPQCGLCGRVKPGPSCNHCDTAPAARCVAGGCGCCRVIDWLAATVQERRVGK